MHPYFLPQLSHPSAKERICGHASHHRNGGHALALSRSPQPLVQRLRTAAERESVSSVAVVGGVAANSLLRRRVAELGEELGVHTALPPLRYCTDNAAMIGAAGEPYAPLVPPPAQPPFGEGENLRPRLPPPQRRKRSRAQPQSSAAVPAAAPVLRGTPQQHQEPSLSAPPHSSL